MDWATFFFGALAGALLTTVAFAIIGVRAMRPFMLAAKQRATGKSMTPPINWTSNDPHFVWPPTKEDADAH